MKILIAGDFCPRARVETLFEKGRYADVLGDARALIRGADFSIVNLECPVVQGGERPREKKGPNLCCSPRGVEALSWAGFSCVTLANNHLLDYGAEGVRATLESCAGEGLWTVGGGMSREEASRTMYKEIGGETLAVINCCEHEFSIARPSPSGGICGEAGANPLDPVRQYYAIKEARREADHVLVIVHGGDEHWPLPSLRMQETYRFFVDAGADGVVNGHQHCFSGYEVYKGKPIFYGLGNFCFDAGRGEKVPATWNEGLMVELLMGEDCCREGGELFRIYPYEQCGEEARVRMVEASRLEARLEELNGVICDRELLSGRQWEHYGGNRGRYLEMLEPLGWGLFRRMRRRGWLPSMVSKRRRLMARDYVGCESHRERLIYHLEND